MPDQFLSLSPVALRQIIEHLDESIALIDGAGSRHSVYEITIKSMLTTLRSQLREYLKRNEQPAQRPDSGE